MKTPLTAIKNPEQENFLNNLKINHFLSDESITDKFVKNFYHWIEDTKYNNIDGLDEYDAIKVTNGSIQIFDFFYLKHFNKRFRFFSGEFMYHQAVLKNGLKFSFCEDDEIRKNDVFITSVPFTRTGYIHKNFFEVLEKCETMKVPVLIDFCHLPCSKNIHLNLKQYECIDTISFSMSKFFHNAEFLRVGIRFQKNKNFIDDGIDIFNSDGIKMNHRLSIGIANEIINKYPINYLWDNFDKAYYKVCEKNNLNATNNIIIAINENNARVCVSDLIYDEYLK